MAAQVSADTLVCGESRIRVSKSESRMQFKPAKEDGTNLLVKDKKCASRNESPSYKYPSNCNKAVKELLKATSCLAHAN